jgi:large subunit ribosomal protein L25
VEKEIKLRVEPRTVRGKKVRFLRREGKVPANVYGPGMDSIAVQVDEKELRRVLRAAGRHHLVHLTVGSKKKTHQVLVRRVQRDDITDAILHVDFHQVPLDKKFTSRVPLVLVGEAPIATSGGILLHVLDHVLIESLPTDLPAALEVDVSALTALDDAIWVQDLIPPANTQILTDGSVLIAKVQRSRLLRAALEEEMAEEEELEGEAPTTEESAASTED